MIPSMLSEYESLCREFDELRNRAMQGNLSTRMEFEKTLHALLDKKENCAHCIQQLQNNLDPTVEDQYRTLAHEALTHFKDTLHHAKMATENARVIPPFRY